MPEDDFDSGVKASVFPFLSVLICTMGVMTLILVVGSLNSTLGAAATIQAVRKDHDTIYGEVARKQKRHDDLKKKIEDIRDAEKMADELTTEADGYTGEAVLVASRVSKRTQARKRLQTSVKELGNRAGSAGVGLGKLRAFRKSRTVAADVEAARAKQEAGARRLASAQSRKESAEKQTDALRAERDRLLARLRRPEARFTFTGQGSDLPRVVLDLHKDHLVVARSDVESVAAGKRVTRRQAVGKEGFLAGLASELARPEQQGFALFVVRPHAVEMYRQARRIFNEKRARFRHKPVEDGWDIKFEAPVVGAPPP